MISVYPVNMKHLWIDILLDGIIEDNSWAETWRMNRALLLYLSIRRNTCKFVEVGENSSVYTEMKFFRCCFIRGLQGAEFLRVKKLHALRDPCGIIIGRYIMWSYLLFGRIFQQQYGGKPLHNFVFLLVSLNNYYIIGQIANEMFIITS